jgi:predicted ATPase/class 3 adenylate cyclase
MTERPTGVVTFLFTDIEGSTARWDTDAEAMRSALARHDQTLSLAIEDAGGWMFKHTGDGVLGAFERPSGAIDAAIAAQRNLGLPVRMGIATGHAEHRNGDYFGPVLNQAARVMSVGHGGQVLVAASTAALVSDIAFVDLGEHSLRGLSQRIRIFQLRADGLDQEFAPLATAARGNLPATQNRLVGRDRELARIADALETSRIVTLTGVGGVGKTRLAIGVADQVHGRYPDGAWFVELASVEHADGVFDAVAAAAAIAPNPGREVRDTVCESFASRHALIVLDNCEHLVDAAADLVADLVSHGPGVTVLTTSREALMVDGEVTWAVPSLRVDDGPASAGVELFVERARAVAPSWSPDDHELGTVSEICRHLEGIPLAIELAAARIRSLGTAEILERLEDRFRLLSGGRRRALERHQTLRHAIQWSFDLLDPPEQAVLLRLSVFASGFGLCAAEAVCGDDDVDAFEVIDHVDSLVRKSLLSVDRDHAEIRFRQLETVRQFAEELLVQSGRANDMRARHARHFADESDEMFEVWRSPEQVRAFEWMDREMENLRLAFAWSADSDDPDAAIRLAANVGDVARFALRSEAYTWPEQMLDQARVRNSARLVSVLTWASSNAWGLRNYDLAQRYAKEALALSGQPGYETFVWAHIDLAISLLNQGEVDRAIEIIRRGADDPADRRDRFCSAVHPLLLTMLGRHDEALSVIAAVREDVDRAGFPVSIGTLRQAEGDALRVSDPAAALEALEIARDTFRSVGATMFEMNALSSIASLYAEQGDMQTSLSHLDAMLSGAAPSIDEGTLHLNLATAAEILASAGSGPSAATIVGWLESRSRPDVVERLTTGALAEMQNKRRAQLIEAGNDMTRAGIITLTVDAIRSCIGQDTPTTPPH